MRIVDLIQTVKKTEDQIAAIRLQVKLARYKGILKAKKKLVRLAVLEG